MEAMMQPQGSRRDHGVDRASQDHKGTRRAQVAAMVRSRSGVRPTNLRGELRVQRLRLARRWRDAGALYQALEGYRQVLIRYPHTGAADASAEELLEMREMLQRAGARQTAGALLEVLATWL